MLVAVRVNPNRLHQGSFRELGITNCHVAFRDAARIRSDGQSSRSSEKMKAANHDYYQIKNLTAALVTVANVALGTHKYQEDNAKSRKTDNRPLSRSVAVRGLWGHAQVWRAVAPCRASGNAHDLRNPVPRRLAITADA